jgi:hypothetical protein
MEQLIFFAIIIAFSIIDSIARTRKKRQAGEALPPTSERQWEWEAEPESEAESYDSQQSYDQVEPEYEYEQEPPAPSKPRSSEGMIPQDIWEEIAGLTKAPLPPTPKPKPKPKPAPRPQVEYESIPKRPVETHRIHRAHAGYGTDPSSRARSEQDGLDPLARTLGLDAAAARSQLKSKGRHALRQAVILQEVLGKPAALRPDPFSEMD